MNLFKLRLSAVSLGVLCAALTSLTGAAWAQTPEPAGSGLRISGFGTLGVVHTDAPEGWGFRRNADQPDNSDAVRADVDSRFGLQLNYQASTQVELVAQFLATRRSADATASDSVEWAFAAFRPSADVTFRAGRLNLDQFVMSDYRNVGFAYMYARPPIEFYASIPTTLDGADLTRTWNLDDSRWRAKAFVGRTKVSGLDLTQALGVTVSREADGLLVRAGLSRAKFAGNGPALQPLLAGLEQIRALPIPTVVAEADALHSRLAYVGVAAVYATLGLSYDHQAWQWTMEFTQFSASSHGKVRAGYAGLGRRFGSVTLYGVASGVHSADAAVAAPAWEAGLTPFIGAAAAQQAQYLGDVAAFATRQSINQNTLSLGARWDIHPQVALKVQWDHARIKADGGQLWANATADVGQADVVTFLVDFVF